MRTAGAVVLLLAVAKPAAALDIIFEFDQDAAPPAAFVAAIEAAAQEWESLLADPAPVRLEILLNDELGLFEAAGTYFDVEIVAYDALRTALAHDATSPDDATAVASLQSGDWVSFRTFGPDRAPRVYSGHDPINGSMAVPRPNAKALGLAVDDGISDAAIVFSRFLYQQGLYDIDRSDGIEGIDLQSIAAHEIGHALGFASGVDDLDLVFHPLPRPPDLSDLPTPEEINEYSVLSVLDLFRYSDASNGLTDMTPGESSYFSVDGGRTAIESFATGAVNGDGIQASHWRGAQGLMAADAGFDVVSEFSTQDLRAMDVIGWDVRRVPEPRTFALLALGACFSRLAGTRRRPRECLSPACSRHEPVGQWVINGAGQPSMFTPNHTN